MVNYTESDDWEKELNDEKNHASRMALNQGYQGSLMKSDDEDWYYFALEKDGMITFAFDHEVIKEANDYWQIQLYSSDGKTGIDSSSDNYWYVSGNKNFVSPEIGLPAGSYYLRVSHDHSSWSDVTYNLTVNYTESDNWEKEPNGAEKGELANACYVNQSYQGSIIEYGDKDWFTFTTEKDGMVTLQFDHEKLEDSEYTWYVALYQYNEETYVNDLVDDWYVAGNKNLTSAEIGIPAGKYYVKVTAYSTSYWSDATYTLLVNYKEAIKTQSITVTQNDIRLAVGDTAQIEFTVLPENTTDALTMSSSDEDIVTVDAEGNLKGISSGDAVITIQSGDLSETVNVTVYVAVESVSLSETEFEGKPGDTLQLEATVEPEDAENQKVSWSSGDSTIATVSDTGLVTLVAPGETEIFVTTKDGSFTDSCAITVKVEEVKPVGWTEIDGNRYYYGDDGKPVTGVKVIDNKTYYFNSKGIMQTGVLQTSKGVFYLDPETGAMHTGWLDYGKNRFYFADNGKMVKGVLRLPDNVYYFNSKGIMQTGVLKTSKGVFYLDPEKGGAMHTGWLDYGKNRYYFASSGKMVNGVKKIDGNTYYFKSGAMQTGFVKVSGNYYYLDQKTGALQTGWIEYKGNKYYAGKDGKVAINCTITIDGKEYTFAKNGICTNP